MGSDSLCALAGSGRCGGIALLRPASKNCMAAVAPNQQERRSRLFHLVPIFSFRQDPGCCETTGVTRSDLRSPSLKLHFNRQRTLAIGTCALGLVQFLGTISTDCKVEQDCKSFRAAARLGLARQRCNSIFLARESMHRQIRGSRISPAQERRLLVRLPRR